jgi:hypothetical protein
VQTLATKPTHIPSQTSSQNGSDPAFSGASNSGQQNPKRSHWRASEHTDQRAPHGTPTLKEQSLGGSRANRTRNLRCQLRETARFSDKHSSPTSVGEDNRNDCSIQKGEKSVFFFSRQQAWWQFVGGRKQDGGANLPGPAASGVETR